MLIINIALSSNYRFDFHDDVNFQNQRKLKGVVMNIIKAIIKFIHKMNEKIAKLFSYCIVLLILALCYEVVARYVFNAPTTWSFDATYFFCSAAMIFGMAYCWQLGGHVKVDIFSVKLPRRVNAALQCIFMVVLFFVCWINILHSMFLDVIKSWSILERATVGFMPPIYPYKTWIMLGVFLLVLEGIVIFIKELYVLIKGEELI